MSINIHSHPGSFVSVGVREFVSRAENSERVRNLIRAKDTQSGREIEAVDLQAIL